MSEFLNPDRFLDLHGFGTYTHKQCHERGFPQGGDFRIRFATNVTTIGRYSMKLSARSRYATRILLDLAEHTGDRPLCASAISESTDISVPFIEQILRPLKKAGYIKSVRGAYGGHIFLKEPSSITLGDIVRTMEGEINISQSCSGPPPCERSGDCRTKFAWSHISRTIERELDTISLADLMFSPDQIIDRSAISSSPLLRCPEQSQPN